MLYYILLLTLDCLLQLDLLTFFIAVGRPKNLQHVNVGEVTVLGRAVRRLGITFIEQSIVGLRSKRQPSYFVIRKNTPHAERQTHRVDEKTHNSAKLPRAN